jgi:hypothetical protein
MSLTRSVQPRTFAVAMKRAFALLLLFGAMLGLFGQEMAFASSLQHAKASSHSVMMPGCTMPMAQRSDSKPCKGLTLECIAAMGCTIPLAQADEVSVVAPVVMVRIAPVEVATKRLTGLHVLPEPEPPHRLI